MTRNAVRLRKRGAEPLLDAVSEEAWGHSDVGVVPAGIERWGGLGDAAQRAIDAETWRDLTDETPDLISPYPHVVAVDRSPVSGVYAIAGAVRTRSGGIHIEVGYSQKASPTEVVERLLDIVTDANPAALLIDSRSPATVLVPYLAQCGIEATVLNTSESAIAAEAFVSAVDAGAGQLTHSGNPHRFGGCRNQATVERRPVHLRLRPRRDDHAVRRGLAGALWRAGTGPRGTQKDAAADDGTAGQRRAVDHDTTVLGCQHQDAMHGAD